MSIKLVNSNVMKSHWFDDKILDIINWFKSDLNHFCSAFVLHDKMTAGSKIEENLTKSHLIGLFQKAFSPHGYKSLTSLKFHNVVIGNRVFSFCFCDNSFLFQNPIWQHLKAKDFLSDPNQLKPFVDQSYIY